MTSLLWFRRDLRLTDHPALAAAATGGPVVPLFVLDLRLLRQWVAGCGTDASPWFRVFNPAIRAEKFDPDGVYVRCWVPEVGTDAYPAPIVDHATERREALDRLERMKE